MLKDFQVDLELSPRDNRVIQTGATYWSHDVNTAKINIKLLRHSEPVVLNKDVTVRVMMLFDDENKSEHIYTAKIEDEKAGIVSVILDKNVRSYVGQVICGVYADYGAEQKTDNGYFTFAMKRSLIDKRMPEMKQYYVSDFEDTLAKMKLANAEFAEVETKLNGRIDKIETDITSNEVVKQIEFTALKKELSDSEIGVTNLLKNTELAEFARNSGTVATHKHGISVDAWNTNDAINVSGKGGTDKVVLFLSDGRGLRLKPNKTYTHSIYIKNNSSNVFFVSNNITKNIKVEPFETRRIVMMQNTTGKQIMQFNILTENIGDAFDFDYFRPKIEEGNNVTGWMHAPEDIFTKNEAKNIQSQIDILKKAITSLGGTL